jgi:hypothetical protein
VFLFQRQSSSSECIEVLGVNNDAEPIAPAWTASSLSSPGTMADNFLRGRDTYRCQVRRELKSVHDSTCLVCWALVGEADFILGLVIWVAVGCRIAKVCERQIHPCFRLFREAESPSAQGALSKLNPIQSNPISEARGRVYSIRSPSLRRRCPPLISVPPLLRHTIPRPTSHHAAPRLRPNAPGAVVATVLDLGPPWSLSGVAAKFKQAISTRTGHALVFSNLGLP